MARKYFTLAVRTDGKWSAQFGDYDRATVQDELTDYRDHDMKAKDLRIVISGDRQSDIDAAIAKLNG